MYADDTALLAETAAGLQKTLDRFENYYNHWKFKINTNKTKVVVFVKGNHSKCLFFILMVKI